MLTAQKENSPLETEVLRQRRPTTRSFDNVVNSIEGLRERVQGFTPEQVVEAEQQLRTLSLQMRELQRTVEAVAEMKQRMSRLQKAVKQAEAKSLEQGKLAAIVEPPAVQAIVRVGALLKFRRVLKALKEAKSDLKVSVTADSESKIRARPNLVQIRREQPNQEQEPATYSPAILDELPTRSSTDGDEVANDTALEQTEAIIDSTVLEMDFEPHEPSAREPSTDVIFNDSRTTIEPPEIIAEFDDTREEPPSSHEPIFEEFKGTGDTEAHLDVPTTETVENTDQSPKSASEDDADFDQRLLDDLIKNYGEFTILPSSTPQDEPKDERKSDPIRTTLRTSTSATVNPAPLANLPSPRKDGDLDRKLKKLIKDYGEYDLYSRQTPLKLKTGVIAAFVLLTLILSGFYFFSSPKTAVPVSASPTSQTQSSLDQSPNETPPKNETRSGETLSAPNVDVPKTVEPGVSHNSANKTTTKKTK